MFACVDIVFSGVDYAELAKLGVDGTDAAEVYNLVFGSADGLLRGAAHETINVQQDVKKKKDQEREMLLARLITETMEGIVPKRKTIRRGRGAMSTHTIR